MKNLLLLIAGVFLFTASYAQKGSVAIAEALLNKGDVAGAKAEVDIAVTIDKNIEKSRTWLIKGKIYKEIALSEDPAVSGLMPTDEAIKEATAALQKSLLLETKGSTNYNLAEYEVEDFWSKYLNGGGEDYSAENFKSSYEKFYKAAIIKPTDSLTLFYAGVAAQQAEMSKESMAMYYRLVEQNDASEDVFVNIVYVERSENKDDAKALSVLQKAKAAYPENADFMREEINILIAMKQANQAIEKLEAAIEREPDNSSLYLNLAVLYDNLGLESTTSEDLASAKAYFAKAQTNYEKTIGIEADNFVANFNVGVIWVNNAKEFYDKARAMDLKTYQKEGGKLVEEGDKTLSKALPYLETAHASKPEDCDVMRALMQVYTQLKQTPKAEAMLNKQDAAGCN